jgi:hypothetical protein
VPPSTCSDREPVAEIGPAIEAAENAGAKALNVLASPMLYDNREAIFGAVARARIPAMYPPTTVALSVNLNTAKVLALIVPPSLLARADEVIE